MWSSRFVAVSASATCVAIVSIIIFACCQQNGSSSADALQLRGWLPLFLRLPDGSVRGEDVRADATVGDLKGAAAVLLECDPQDIKLHHGHGGKSLLGSCNGDALLSEAGVCAEAVIGVGKIDIATILNQFFKLLHDEPFHFSKEDFESRIWTTDFDESYGILNWTLRNKYNENEKILEITKFPRYGYPTDDDNSDGWDENESDGEDDSDGDFYMSCMMEPCGGYPLGIGPDDDIEHKKLRYLRKRKVWEIIRRVGILEDIIQEFTNDFIVHSELHLRDLFQLMDTSLPTNATWPKIIDTLEGM